MITFNLTVTYYYYYIYRTKVGINEYQIETRRANALRVYAFESLRNTCLTWEPKSDCPDITIKKSRCRLITRGGSAKIHGEITVKYFSDDMREARVWPEVHDRNTVDNWPPARGDPNYSKEERLRSTGYTRCQNSFMKQRKHLRITEISLKLHTRDSSHGGTVK